MFPLDRLVPPIVPRSAARAPVEASDSRYCEGGHGFVPAHTAYRSLFVSIGFEYMRKPLAWPACVGVWWYGLGVTDPKSRQIRVQGRSRRSRDVLVVLPGLS